jgi:hydroxymethylbilane synthase
MLTIGTRGSTLALAQAHWVAEKLLALHPDVQMKIRIIHTSADKDPASSIRSGTATGVFVKEIEEVLLSSGIDLAVHSMKDLPTRIPDALEIGAIPQREDARDALIGGAGAHRLDDLPPGAVIGTGSVRRQAQILALRPDVRPEDIRGNVQTRLRKLAAGSYDAVILACAGLNRLGLQDRIGVRLELAQMLPAPGQGALALEVRKGDSRVTAMVAGLNDPLTATAVLAERAFLRRMGGGCNSPIAVHARPLDGKVLIEGLVANPDGTRLLRDSAVCPPASAVAAADALADKLLSAGGAEILRSLR